MTDPQSIPVRKAARLVLIDEHGTESVWSHDPADPIWWGHGDYPHFDGWRALALRVEQWLGDRAGDAP